MSDALATIETYLRGFREGVERCRSTQSDFFNAPDWQDAYERLYRLLTRFDREKGRLDKLERTALSKPFENDEFIQNLRTYRVVGSHIQSDVAQKKGYLEIRISTDTPIHLVAETSAMAMFSASVVALDDVHGHTHKIDHLANLEEAERRFVKAFDKLPIALRRAGG